MLIYDLIIHGYVSSQIQIFISLENNNKIFNLSFILLFYLFLHELFAHWYEVSFYSMEMLYY